MRQWYQGKLAERLGQFSAMMKDRNMVRRGALKMQDGTLGQEGDPLALEDSDMNIRVGDEVHYHTPAAEVVSSPVATTELTSEPKQSLLTKTLPFVLASALGASGIAVPAWMAGAFSKPVTLPSVKTAVDTDTQYTLELVSDDETTE